MYLKSSICADQLDLAYHASALQALNLALLHYSTQQSEE